MTNTRKLGSTLLLAFSIAATGYAAFNGVRSAAYQFGTDNYDVAAQTEKKIESGQSVSNQELRTLVDVKNNEKQKSVGLGVAVFGFLGFGAWKGKKISNGPG